MDFHPGEAEPGVVQGLLHVSVYIITTSAWLCNLMWGVIVWDGGNDESMMIRQNVMLEEGHVAWLRGLGPSMSEVVRELINVAMDKPSFDDDVREQLAQLRREVDHLKERSSGLTGLLDKGVMFCG